MMKTKTNVSILPIVLTTYQTCTTAAYMCPCMLLLNCMNYILYQKNQGFSSNFTYTIKVSYTFNTQT